MNIPFKRIKPTIKPTRLTKLRVAAAARYIISVLISVWTLSASALEGEKMPAPPQLHAGYTLRFDDFILKSLELRWKMPDLKEVKEGNNKLLYINLYTDRNTRIADLNLAVNFGGMYYGFNDDKYENLKIYFTANYLEGDKSDSSTVELAGVNPRKFSTLKLVVKDNVLSVFAGAKEYELLTHVPIKQRITGVSLNSEHTIDIDALYLSKAPFNAGDIQTDIRSAWVRERLQSVSPQSIEGVYHYLDSDLNDKRAIKGGDYIFYLRPAEAGVYELIYLDGAKANNALWQEGMIKGRLKPTIFENHYDVEWYDSQMANDFEELWAEFTSGTILTIHFPLEKSQLRFYRLPFY